jgi:tetratricopeptide (TPR) repeat protein
VNLADILGCQTFNHIAEKVSDNPLDLAQVGAFLPLLSDPAQMTTVLDQDDKSINDVPQEYNQWIDLCVMLGPEHLPIILLELELDKNTAKIVEGLTELQKRSWVLIGDDSKTFQISQIRRRWRRRDLLGDQRVATCAQRACASVVALLEHTAKLPESTSKSIEDLLLKHVDDCFDNLRRWGRLIDCEWDILARFCEKHGLHDKARVFYRANQSQRLNNSNTCSRHSISSTRSLSYKVSSEDWHEVENVDLEHEPEEIWYDTRSLGSSRRRSTNSDAIVDDIYALRDTKTSRALRSELGEIRMQIQLHDKESLEERCHKVLNEVENRSEPRYVGLRNEALRGMMQIKLAQGEVLDSIQYGYKLAESLETALGPSAEETMNAIHELARLHMDQGDYMKAEPLLKQVLITYKRSWGHNHLKTMTVSHDLAEAYKGQGNATRSEALYHSIIEKYQEMWGLDHIRTAQAHEGLATVYDMVRDYKAADHHYKTALNAAKLLGTGNEEYRSMLQRRRLLQEKRK